MNSLIELKQFEDDCLGLIQPAAQPAAVTLPISFIDDRNNLVLRITELDIPNNKIKFDRFYGLGEQDLNQEK